ncbi:MAG TPA: hypothetical protein VE011_03560 [Candidatus Dormibacteraeota bacterium]|nr:hypothetical protein [Candidatus Dormibacteraeota bacterium]
MTASELTFLVTGLLLGAAGGAALVMVLGNRPNRREIRVTVTRGAVPGRSETLSQGALVARAAGPARGGPGDRRQADREAGAPLRWTPELTPDLRPAGFDQRGVGMPPDRTIVPSVAPSVGIPIQPEVDTELADLRRRPAQGSALERMLRGDHRAMVEVVDALAGEDSRQRRSWELLLGELVEAFATVAVRESVIDFPLGTAFWDSFTVEQCRRVVAALDSMGYRYDGRSGWEDARIPTYRDVSQALADSSLEPRRMRVWPNATEIAGLFVGARPAPEELLAAAGPDYAADDVRAVLGEHAAGLDDLWLAWEIVQPVLFEEAPVRDEAIAEPALAAGAAGASSASTELAG